MIQPKTEIAKRKRKCSWSGCKEIIPIGQRCLTCFEEKQLPVRTVLVKKSFCPKHSFLMIMHDTHEANDVLARNKVLVTELQ